MRPSGFAREPRPLDEVASARPPAKWAAAVRLGVCLGLALGLLTAGPDSARAQHADFALLETAEQPETPPGHRFVHPITAPYAHSDAFVTTDVRPWFIYHDFPGPSAIDGGQATVYAVQLRLALTNELQLVAYKDGHTNFETGLVDAEGWADLAGGLKWKLLEDREKQLHGAVGLGYEAKTGDSRVLNNDDEWRFWGALNKGFDRLHLGATGNLFLKTGGQDTLGDSDRVSWHLHADYRLNRWVSPVLEVNGYHVLNEGNAVLPFQGVDVTNLGGGKGEEVITAGVGGELRPLEDVALRAAYETPLTQSDSLFGYRWTLSAVFSF